MRIVGLRVEKYIGTNITGHNCAFEYFDEEMERYVVCLLSDDNKSYELSLYNSFGQCGSGWCTASFGHADLVQVPQFSGFTHLPKSNLSIPISVEELGSEYFYSDIFSCDAYGGDEYYPSGSVYVNLDLFTPNARAKDKRPVWIFYGYSALGKSYLAGKINMTVYETDSNSQLPDTIKEDIVVLGNKYQFTVEDIVERLFGDPEVILVSFNKL